MKKYKVTDKHLLLKKYKVTDKHPGLKEDIVFSDIKHDDLGVYRIAMLNNEPMATIPINIFREWVQDLFVEEIQEPEFTRKDMIDFLKYAEDNAFNLNYEDLLDKWIYSINESAK